MSAGDVPSPGRSALARDRQGRFEACVSGRRGSMEAPGPPPAPLAGMGMQTETTIDIRGPLPRIVALAADVERWPQILPHYRWVTLLGGGGDRKVVEMAARRGRIPVRWRAVQEIDRTGPTPVIAYRHIWGVTRGMDVAWTFAEAA